MTVKNIINLIESAWYCLLIQKCRKYFHKIHASLQKIMYFYENTMLSSASWIIYSTFEFNITLSEVYHLDCGQLP